MIANKKKNKFLVYSIAFCCLFLIFPFVCHAADPIDRLLQLIFGWVASFFVWALGGIMSLVIGAIIEVTKYNKFVNEPSIVSAWQIVRDFSNMWFILILLVIAFATILRIETYNMKRWLPKLLIMAVLINFSRTICGIMIDFSQIIMLTFVNTFATTGGDFINYLRIQEFVSAVKDTGGDWNWTKDNSIDLTKVTVAYIIAVIFMLVGCVSMIAILIVFMMRMIMLWIFVVLSPLAFMLSSFPQGQTYASRYWGEFTKYLINGPALAFFIWLALSTVGQLKPGDFSGSENSLGLVAGTVQILTLQNFIPFVLAIGFLVGGLMISSQIGGVGANWGYSTARKLGDKGLNVGRGGINLGKSGAKNIALWTGRKVDQGQMLAQSWVATKLGVDKYRAKTFNPRLIKQGFEKSRLEEMGKYETFLGPHGSLVWEDATNKYFRLSQYLGGRKSDKREAIDNAQADKLEFMDTKMQTRIMNSEEVSKEKMGKMDLDEKNLLVEGRNEKRIELEKNRVQIINDYKRNSGFEEDSKEAEDYANKEFDKDIQSLRNDPDKVIAQEKLEEYKNTIIKNTPEIAKLRETRLWGIGEKIKYKESEAGAQDKIKKEEGEIATKSENDFAVITELLDAVKDKNSTRAVAALNVLTKNNDLNEALRDRRVVNLMVKENGLLQQLVNQKRIKGKDGLPVDYKQLADNYRNNPVTPAFAQAMVMGLLKETNLSDHLAARYANNIGNKGFAAGNALAYGMARGDVSKGCYVFDDLVADSSGRLHTSYSRRAAINGKFANMESQTKMRAIHPDNFIAEGLNSEAVGITDEGKSFLRSLTGHDLGQIGRLRTDVINKIGKSQRAMADLVKLVKECEEAENYQQAEIIKVFAGYIKIKSEGAKGIKERDDALNAFNQMAGRPVEKKEKKSKQKEKVEEEDESSKD